jgi:hypothetical protein
MQFRLPPRESLRHPDDEIMLALRSASPGVILSARTGRDILAAVHRAGRVQWFLEVEWDRRFNTGSYERHASEAEARASLADHQATDPPARWRIYRQTTIEDRLEESGDWPVSP